MARWGLSPVALLLALSLGSLGSAQEAQADDALQGVTAPPIAWFWQLDTDDNQRGIQRCSSPLSLATDNPQSAATPVFPLYMFLFPIGGQPSTQFVLDGPNLTYFQWTANLPVGTNFSISMTDSSKPQNSGGTVDGFYITEGFNNCTDAPQAASPLSISLSPNDTACGEIDVAIHGGESPYTISLLSGTSGLYGNLTGLRAENGVKLRNTIPSGQKFNLFVTDNLGLTSNVTSTMTSALGSPVCNVPDVDTGDSSSTSAPLSAIIGGAVGGVVAALLLALLAWWLLRRRSEKANQRYREEELATKGEFRMADGTVPLVQPFVVPPQRSSDYAESTSPTSAHPSFSPHDYPYSGSHTTPPPALPHSAYTHSQSSPTSPNSQHNSYPSYGDESYRTRSYDPSYEPTAASSTVDGLANPEEFAYRDAGTWIPPNGQTPSLPPGAQRPTP